MKLTIHCFLISMFFIAGITHAGAQLAYSEHTLATGETLSVLAKNYHTTVGDIMRMNGMNAQSQLHVGDKIKIPAGGTVMAQKPAAPAVAPVAQANATAKTHVVATGETLFHISQVYKITVDKLKALNNLTDGNVKVGQTLLVSEGSIPQSAVKTVTGQGMPTTKPAPVSTPQNSTATAPVKENAPVKNSVTEPAKKETIPVTAVTPQMNTGNVSAADNSNNSTVYSSPVNAPKEGFFTSLYGKETGSKQEQVKNGAAMTFKSASGWADKKYYILMNGAPTGSIVKVGNGKNELYAKVLWSLGEMKENDGLTFRISTATAAALGINDQKFDLRVSYFE